MSINLTLVIQMLVALVFWMSISGALAYYIDRAVPKVAKKSALIAACLSLIPVFSFAFIIYLYLTANRRLVTNL